jgi:tRNA (cytidine/uridine-2'-O-)-methyltransferase
MRLFAILDESSPVFRIVLIEPEIPQNTGNIGRTCVGTRCELHLVGELGFEINDKQLKRAGLDYWQHLTWFHHATFADWMAKVEDPKRVFYFSTKAQQFYTQVHYQRGDWLVFGKETKGLDPDLVRRNANQAVKIPLLGPTRSLNLGTSVAIAAYEGIRQLGESKSLSF